MKHSYFEHTIKKVFKMHQEKEIETQVFYQDSFRSVLIQFEFSEKDSSVGYAGYVGITGVFEHGFEIEMTSELNEVCLKAIEERAKDVTYNGLVENYLQGRN